MTVRGEKVKINSIYLYIIVSPLTRPRRTHFQHWMTWMTSLCRWTKKLSSINQYIKRNFSDCFTNSKINVPAFRSLLFICASNSFITSEAVGFFKGEDIWKKYTIRHGKQQQRYSNRPSLFKAVKQIATNKQKKSLFAIHLNFKTVKKSREL